MLTKYLVHVESKINRVMVGDRNIVEGVFLDNLMILRGGDTTVRRDDRM